MLEKPLRADAARNRERILAAAEEVFASRGLDASLDDIAAHAGLGVGTVYRRFANRDELIEALFQQRLDQIASLATEATSDPDSWVGHLRPDASPTDFPMMLRMISAVADFTREVRPELWRRYLAIFLDGMRAERNAVSPLAEPPIDPVEVDAARSCWRAQRR